MREKFAFDPALIADLTVDIIDNCGLRELVLVSTCNRTELYFCGPGYDEVQRWLSHFSGINEEKLTSFLYRYSGVNVVLHASRVTSGLDSMVLGETQIVGQMKMSYRKAHELGSLGPNLTKIFDTSFSLSKEVRAKTEVGSHSVSLASAALKITRSVFADSDERSIVFIGAGEMITLCANHFLSKNYSRICFANRTDSKSKDLATRFRGDSISLERMLEKLFEFDIVISCTASPVPLIGKGALERAIRVRKHKPMAIFDLAVPRDVEPESSALEDIFLFSVDDLAEITRENRSNREAAVMDAEKIIKKGGDSFSDWVSTREVLPVLKSFREYGESIINTELEKVIRSEGLAVNPENSLRLLSRGIKNKFLDRPSRLLNRVSGAERRLLADALLKLFELESKE